MLKLLVVVLNILLLSACTQVDSTKKTVESSEAVIELEDNTEESNTSNFNQNSEIESNIYKEYFYNQSLLSPGSMESGEDNGTYHFHGRSLPVSTESLPEPYYMDYQLDLDKQFLELALIFEEGTEVNDAVLKEDVFILIEYNQLDNELINITQENKKGENAYYINLTEEEWIEVANRYSVFVNSIK